MVPEHIVGAITPALIAQDHGNPKALGFGHGQRVCVSSGWHCNHITEGHNPGGGLGLQIPCNGLAPLAL